MAYMKGVVIVNKPRGWTSFDAVAVCRKRLHEKTIGHTGTLDPLATGVLVMAVGAATRLIEVMAESSKYYEVKMLFGAVSPSYDTETELTKTGKPLPTPEEITAVIAEFIGAQKQRPPAFSACKVNGERAYKKARRGENVQLEEKNITIFDIRIMEIKNESARLIVHCGPGTYIRSLVHDIGMKLSCGAVMSELTRVRVGEFDLGHAVCPTRVGPQHVRSMQCMVAGLPHIQLTPREHEDIRHGRPISARAEAGSLIAAMHNETLSALLKRDIDVLRPYKVFTS